MPNLRVAGSQPGTLPPLLAGIARLLDGAACHHCGRNPFQTGASGVPDHDSGVGSGGDLDAVDDDELWLWRLVEEGERVLAAAPAQSPQAEVTAAAQALIQASAACDRLRAQISSTEAALANPVSWLHPSRRSVLVKELRRQQAGAVVAESHRGRAELRTAALAERGRRRIGYLAENRETLDAAENARTELTRHIDDLIHRYGRMPDPPPWFRYGLGYPPDPNRYPEWLREARLAIGHRRRHGIDHPLEP